jgi:nicotinate-nucleotide adenylyltransferase
MTKRKIALFGGTFDPIHLGHTTVAANAAKQIGAEKTIFIPAKCSPMKKVSPHASDNDRLQMVTLAIADNKNFYVSDYELRKSEPSFTLETVRYFQAEHTSDTSIYWLAGADSINDLPNWYEIEKLLDQCNLCIMRRAGCKQPDFSGFENIWGPERIKKLQRNIIQTPLIDISSTQVRNRLAAGLDATDILPPAVADYILKYNLYK